MNDAQLMQQAGGVNVHATGTPPVKHFKYPETVGNDTRADNINFNSHNSSEYAIRRMDNISTMTNEPFVMFEFMTIDEDKAQAKIKAGAEEVKAIKSFVMGEEYTGPAFQDLTYDSEFEGTENLSGQNDELKQKARSGLAKATAAVKDFIIRSNKMAERNYTGSIAMYMPTDIQINDTMMYNEDSRKLGAALNAFVSGEDGELVNWTTLTDPAVLAAGGAALSAFGLPAAVTAVIGGTLGQIAQTEVQRHTGKIMNPNELLQYQSTGLRSFTFNWTILPDNQNESDQAAGLIKFFRKSAHAKRTSSTLVTVPDHVVTSFHGARDMIQLPPCFIETVNVTYNPNNSSFFRRNNSPVEIGLSVVLKEIVPIYAHDVERGY